MKLTNINIEQIIQLEDFETFFSCSLDKKLQYSNIDELIKFVFGSKKNAVREFLKVNKELNKVIH